MLGERFQQPLGNSDSFREALGEPVEKMQRHRGVGPGVRQAAAEHPALVVKPVEQRARPREDRA